MAGNLPVVCVFGVKNVELLSAPNCPPFETKDLDCRCYLTDDDLPAILVRDRPNSIISIGEPNDFPKLMVAPVEITRRWLNFKNIDELLKVGEAAFRCFLASCLEKRNDLPPLISVFTPTYRTGERINRAYRSLVEQTYRNWEWVIFDDSNDSDHTFRQMKQLADADFRISVFKAHRHSGVIGEVKYWAANLCNGEFLVEFDHDDEFTPNALGDIVSGFQQFPQAGFVYTDFAEVLGDFSPATYPNGWGLGYGSYRQEVYKGHHLMVCNAANINPKTIRHIVSAPNHARCWRKSFYQSIGGHNRLIHVADDYELMVRTFLKTRMARVPKLCYIQYADGGSTNRVRNKEIQRLVRSFSEWYDSAIHRRFVELDVDDFVWQYNASSFSRLETVPNPKVEPHCTLTAT